MNRYLEALERIGNVRVSDRESVFNSPISTYCYSDMELLKGFFEHLDKIMLSEMEDYE